MLLLAICRVALLTQFAIELFALAARGRRAAQVAIPTTTVARHRHHDVADAVGIVHVCIVVVVVVVVVAGIEEFAATAVLVQHVCEHFFFVGEQLAALGARDGEDRRRVLQPINDVLMMVIAVSVVVVDGVAGGNGVEHRVVDHACRRGRRRSAVSGARLGRVATSVCA